MQKLSIHNFIFSILIIISLIVFWFVFTKLQTKEPNQKITNNTQEYMYNLNIHNYDEQGLLKNSIIAASWQFYPEQQYSIVKQPNIVIYKPTGQVYNITANFGNIMHTNTTLNDNISLIKLFNNVYINQQHAYNQSTGFTLNTSYLEFNPSTELASTTKDVTITKVGLVITGTGMNANLKQNQLELHKNVSTKYLATK
ncbi:MAG: LPS export ABC transporter periplasmic protein LptC [Gammaproteobacteria bacterium]|jgi:LPS export ABC transporter protein LptC